jgi:hypothetical protein
LWAQEMKERLKTGKYYLKTDFKTHVCIESQCADHCRVFALSDYSDEELKEDCKHDHLMSCSSCDALTNVLVEVEIALSSTDICFRYVSFYVEAVASLNFYNV